MTLHHEMVAGVVPNILTRVPREPVPDLPRGCAAVVPAKTALWLFSCRGRPRVRYATPGSHPRRSVLSVATGLTSIVCLAAVASLNEVWRIAAALVLALFAAGSLCVAAVGLAQRFAKRTV